METHLADWLKGTPDGIEAEAILRRCVHCGFCTATCPTYQLLGDERGDGRLAGPSQSGEIKIRHAHSPYRNGW